MFEFRNKLFHAGYSFYEYPDGRIYVVLEHEDHILDIQRDTKTQLHYKTKSDKCIYFDVPSGDGTEVGFVTRVGHLPREKHITLNEPSYPGGPGTISRFDHPFYTSPLGKHKLRTSQYIDFVNHVPLSDLKNLKDGFYPSFVWVVEGVRYGIPFCGIKGIKINENGVLDRDGEWTFRHGGFSQVYFMIEFSKGEEYIEVWYDHGKCTNIVTQTKNDQRYEKKSIEFTYISEPKPEEVVQGLGFSYTSRFFDYDFDDYCFGCDEDDEEEINPKDFTISSYSHKQFNKSVYRFDKQPNKRRKVKDLRWIRSEISQA